MLLIDAVGVKRLGRVCPRQCAENVRLPRIWLDQIGELAFDILDCLAYCRGRQPRRKDNRIVEVSLPNHRYRLPECTYLPAGG